VSSSIAHKGTDFRATEGTEVMSINKGIVRLAKEFPVSGNTIVIDHGLGLSSIYMHLSKIQVKENDIVEAGQIIGLSGQTGNVLGAHLHLSIKIGGISIDPIKFLKIFDVI
jgi:murein DD-endopeptidase MepM/ murein hydrolase activator NlpD